MKTLILVPDGMADLPLTELDGRTPLAAARTINMDTLAQSAEVGLAQIVPENFSPGSEIANASLIGQHLTCDYLPRGPLECVSLGYDQKPGEVAYRVNLVTVDGEMRMQDYSGGHPDNATAKKIITELAAELGITMLPGKSYRHILIMNGDAKNATYPPHQNVGSLIMNLMPTPGPDQAELHRIIKTSYELLKDRGYQCNMLWPWGGGIRPDFVNQAEKYKLKGAFISAVDLLMGIGILSGFDVITVPGATGYIDTDYQAKADYTVNAFKQGYDFVYLHVEAPDEASHMGNLKEKMRAIENIDRTVLGTILNYFRNQPDAYQILIAPDHHTPVHQRIHTSDPVPYLWVRSNRLLAGPSEFSEYTAGQTNIFLPEGWKLFDRIMK